MANERHTQHLPQWKKDEVESIKKLIGEYSVFGTVAIRGISSSQMQSMRRDLNGTAVLKISRNSLINKAFSDLGINELVDHVEDQTALIFTCLLYTSDAADEEDSVDLGGRRII